MKTLDEDQAGLFSYRANETIPTGVTMCHSHFQHYDRLWGICADDHLNHCTLQEGMTVTAQEKATSRRRKLLRKVSPDVAEMRGGSKYAMLCGTCRRRYKNTSTVPVVVASPTEDVTTVPVSVPAPTEEVPMTPPRKKAKKTVVMEFKVARKNECEGYSTDTERLKRHSVHGAFDVIFSPPNASKQQKIDNRVAGLEIVIRGMKEETKEIAEKIGICKPVMELTLEEVLDLQQQSKITNTTLRTISQFMSRKYGSNPFGSVEKRSELKDSLTDKLLYFETAAIHKEKSTMIGYVVHENVWSDLTKYIQSQQEKGYIAWQTGQSTDLLSLKVSGDKGGNFTNLVLTIVNSVDGDSADNCFFLATYTGVPEQHEAMKTVFGDIYKMFGSKQGTEMNLPPVKSPHAFPLPTYQLPLCHICQSPTAETPYLIQCCAKSQMFLHTSCTQKWVEHSAGLGIKEIDHKCIQTECGDTSTWQNQLRRLGITIP